MNFRTIEIYIECEEKDVKKNQLEIERVGRGESD